MFKKLFTIIFLTFLLIFTGGNPTLSLNNNETIYKHRITLGVISFGEAKTNRFLLTNADIPVLIIPHHLVAEKQIEETLVKITSLRQKPNRIILMGPNHFSAGKNQVITIDHSWQTNYGTIKADQDFINLLVAHNLAKKEEKILENDHAITNLLPFIAYFFPDAEIVPLLMREPMSKNDTNLLCKFLAEKIANDTLIIASIDFSHYLPKFIADLHDETSIAALNNLDFDFFAEKIDADSPQILMSLTPFLQKNGTEKFTLLSHTNSADLTGDKNAASTTSHIIGYFEKGRNTSKKQVTVFLTYNVIAPINELPLLYKGNDFNFLYIDQPLNPQNFEEIKNLIDKIIFPAQEEPIIFEKNGIKIALIPQELDTKIHNADVSLFFGKNNFKKTLLNNEKYWNVEDGPSELIVNKDEENKINIRLCFFREEKCE